MSQSLGSSKFSGPVPTERVNKTSATRLLVVTIFSHRPSEMPTRQKVLFILVYIYRVITRSISVPC